MADNTSNQQGGVQHNRDVAPGRETAEATDSADDSARETMNRGSSTGADAHEGTADNGREPEYYADKQMGDQ